MNLLDLIAEIRGMDEMKRFNFKRVSRYGCVSGSRNIVSSYCWLEETSSWLLAVLYSNKALSKWTGLYY